MLLIIYFQFFVGGRQSLAFALLYYGLSFIIAPNGKSKLTCFILFGIFATLSFYCHRSAIIYIAVAIISIILKLNKKTILLSIIAFPILYGSLLLIINNFLDYGLIGESESAHGEGYLNSEDYGEINNNGLIRRIIDWTPIILLFVFTIFKLARNREWKRADILYFKQAYILFYISWLFRGQLVSKFLAPRFMDACLFPLTLFSAVYLIDKRNNRYVRFAFIMFILSDLYRWLYGIYKAA